MLGSFLGLAQSYLIFRRLAYFFNVLLNHVKTYSESLVSALESHGRRCQTLISNSPGTKATHKQKPEHKAPVSGHTTTVSDTLEYGGDALA
jgi:uncharacterized membrane protein required for colicin V production